MNLKFYLFVSGVNQGMREGDESKISLRYSRGLGDSPQSFHKRGGVI